MTAADVECFGPQQEGTPLGHRSFSFRTMRRQRHIFGFRFRRFWLSRGHGVIRTVPEHVDKLTRERWYRLMAGTGIEVSSWPGLRAIGCSQIVGVARRRRSEREGDVAYLRCRAGNGGESQGEYEIARERVEGLA
jgi:hypothetical protein